MTQISRLQYQRTTKKHLGKFKLLVIASTVSYLLGNTFPLPDILALSDVGLKWYVHSMFFFYVESVLALMLKLVISFASGIKGI